jgi:hypothetical protein
MELLPPSMTLYDEYMYTHILEKPLTLYHYETVSALAGRVREKPQF